MFAMDFDHDDALKKCQWVGGGSFAYIYRVIPSIVVKVTRPNLTRDDLETEGNPFMKEIAFFKRVEEQQERCQSIIECLLMCPDRLYLPYCENGTITPRICNNQEREPTKNRIQGRVIRIKGYEDPALVARWIQQLTSALAYVEKLGFCHNDIHMSNCLLDRDLNLKLTDFGRATTIGQYLEGVLPPRSMPILAGPMKGTYGLCSARTEQFAVGTLLYCMVYGYEPHDDEDWFPLVEWDRRFGQMIFPELNRHEVFDGLISACWYNVYPTMALAAYDFKRKTKDIRSAIEDSLIDTPKEKGTSAELVRNGLLGPELDLRFQKP